MKKINNPTSAAKKVSPSGGEPAAGGRGEGSNVNLREIQELVGEVHPGDGVDPRQEAKRRRRAARDSQAGLVHKTHQEERFVAQVQMAIDCALQTAAAPILNSLAVHEVVKQAGSLLVIVVPRDPAERLDVQVATRALKQAGSMLSREVAAAITRKETPHLSFVVLPGGATRIDE
jgi:hypothetical protein